MVGEDEGLTRLRSGVIGSVRKFRLINLDMLQVEIIGRLMEGRRTATELVIEIFEVKPGQPDYQARYAGIRRGLKDLESRGFISTNLIGRDRPYRLTRHGIAVLCSIIPEEGVARILEKKDIILLGSTGLVAILMVLLRNSGEAIVFSSFAAFFTLLGLSLRTYIGILRKVA